MAMLFVAVVAALLCGACWGLPRPPFPLTVSRFEYQRYTSSEWDRAFKNFSSLGGDTAFITGEYFMYGTKDQITSWSGDLQECRMPGGETCVNDVEKTLTKKGLTIDKWSLFTYEMDYSDAIMRCPDWDRKVESAGKTFYILVLPTDNSSKECELQTNASVYVTFTSFNGRDPHIVFLESASKNNIDVYLTLPRLQFMGLKDKVPETIRLMYAYKSFWSRYVAEQRHRLLDHFDNIVGYFFDGVDSQIGPTLFDIHGAIDDQPGAMYLDLGVAAVSLAHAVKVKLAVSLLPDLNRVRGSIDYNVDGFKAVVVTFKPDVIMVMDGRATGRTPYYWPGENTTAIVNIDPNLDRILRLRGWNVNSRPTFIEQYTGSAHQLFQALQDQYLTFTKLGQYHFEFWANIEIYDYLRDLVCVPKGKSPFDYYQRVDMPRLTKSITAIGVYTNRIAAWSWDPYMTCVTPDLPTTLYEDISTNKDRRVISECRFHNAHNRSVVVIGYNMDKSFDTFEVHWHNWQGVEKSTSISGYYYETDYGVQHGIVPSVEYVMLWDFLPLQELIRAGYITVSTPSAYNSCTFHYSMDNTRGHLAPVTRDKSGIKTRKMGA